VIAVWTGAEIAESAADDFRDPAAEALRPYRQPLLAQQRLRYVGEPVAAVFATDAYLAEMRDLVTIVPTSWRPVLAADAPPGNFVPAQSTEALVLRAIMAEVDAAFASAHAVVHSIDDRGRHSGVPIETRGAVAVRTLARRGELYGATKVRIASGRRWADVRPQHHRGGPEGGQYRRRVRRPRELYPEDFLVCLRSCDLERPSNDRGPREHLMAGTTHASSATMPAWQ